MSTARVLQMKFRIVDCLLLENLGISKPWRSLMINIVARESHISPLKALRIENDAISKYGFMKIKTAGVEIPNGIIWAERISLIFEQDDSKI